MYQVVCILMTFLKKKKEEKKRIIFFFQNRPRPLFFRNSGEWLSCTDKAVNQSC